MDKRRPIGDWILLFFCLVLAFGSSLGWLYPRHPHDRLTGITGMVGFSLAALVFIGTLWRHHKDKRYRGIGPVTIAPGVKLGLRKGRLLFLGAALAGFGALVAVSASAERETLVAVFGVIFSLGGLTLLFFLVTGIGGSNYLLFEKEGLRIGDAKGSFLAAWDNIAQVAPGEYQRNAVVWLWFKDLSVAAATAKGQGKHWSPGKVLSGFGASQTLQGAHWMVMTWHYGVDAPILAQAVATYAADPAVRKGLEEHLKLPG